MKRLIFYNNFHYGDCLASLHFLNHLTKVNDVECVFRCFEHYHHQLKEFVHFNPRITLEPIPQENFGRHDLRSRGEDRSINLWCCPSIRRLWGSEPKDLPRSTYSTNFPNQFDVGIILFEIWKLVCETNDLVCPFTSKDDIIFDEEVLSYDTHPKKYDFLLVNSYCNSGQMKITHQQQDSIFLQIIEILRRNNISYITTHKLGEHECTLDYNMSLVRIGQLSKHSKVIFGVPTSPFWITVNKWTMENCIKYVNYTNDFTAFDFKDKMTNISDLVELSVELKNLMDKVHESSSINRTQ